MTTLEDRLRAHYADRTAREPLPGPPADDALDALQRGEPRLVALPEPSDPHRRRRGRWAQHRGLLAAAATVLVALVVAGTLVVTQEDRKRVATDPDRPPETTVPPEPMTSPTTTAPSTTPDDGSDEGATPPPAAGLIVASEGVVGRWDGSGWVQWNPGDPPPGGDEYDVVDLTGVVRTQQGQVGPNTCSPAGEATIELGLAVEGGDEFQPEPIGVAGVAEPQPRPVEVLEPSAAVYQQAATAVAEAEGIEGPAPTVTQAVRADLEGDGSDEVIVTAERPSDDSTAMLRNDVALVFLRRVDGSEAENFVLRAFYPGVEEAPGDAAYRVAALADLNGDGRLEIAVRSFSAESSGLQVYELTPDGKPAPVLAVYCGV